MPKPSEVALLDHYAREREDINQLFDQRLASIDAGKQFASALRRAILKKSVIRFVMSDNKKRYGIVVDHVRGHLRVKIAVNPASRFPDPRTIVMDVFWPNVIGWNDPKLIEEVRSHDATPNA